MSIVQPPLPLHQLQSHMVRLHDLISVCLCVLVSRDRHFMHFKINLFLQNTPTRITAVPNVAAGYHQQQMYSDMTQVPQSTPVRANSVMPQRGPTPSSQTPSHIAQLGQFVHGNQQHGQQLNQTQIAHIKMMQAAQAAQSAQSAQAAQSAQLGGLPATSQTPMQGPGQNPYGQPMPQQNPQQMNQ